MDIKKFSRKLKSKSLSMRVSAFHWFLRSRNHHIVTRRPIKLRCFEEETDFPDKQMILRLARECHSLKGCYPISFSWPRTFNEPKSFKINSVSTVIPYAPYSFVDAEEYYEDYSRSILAVTQKKGGWDCFRHLEIIGAGCAPLFLSAKRIPKYTMIHYPKDLLNVVGRNYWKHRLLPSHEIITKLINYGNSAMTSEAMCKYFSTLSNFDIEPSDSILFVDSKLSTEPDYLSVLNFIGLKQVYGDQVQSLYEEPDYLYLDTTLDVSGLYGRGFGYTKVLTRGRVPSDLSSSPKILVVSNLERDLSLVSKLKETYPDSKLVLFWGADRPIPQAIKEKILLLGAVLFCREIY